MTQKGAEDAFGTKKTRLFYFFPQFVLFSCLDPLVIFLVILSEGRNKFFQGLYSTILSRLSKNLYPGGGTAIYGLYRYVPL